MASNRLVACKCAPKSTATKSKPAFAFRKDRIACPVIQLCQAGKTPPSALRSNFKHTVNEHTPQAACTNDTNARPASVAERMNSSSLASTSARSLIGIGQSCLVAFGAAVGISKAQGSKSVSQQHLLLGLLRDGQLLAAIDNLRILSSSVSASSWLLSATEGAEQAQGGALGVAFSDCTASVLQTATQLARQLGSAAVEADHVLLAVLNSPSSSLKSMIKNSGLDLQLLRDQVLSFVFKYSEPQKFTSAAFLAVVRALGRSPQPGKRIITTLQLLFGVLHSPSAAAEILQAHGVTEAKLERYMEAMLYNDEGPQTPTAQLPMDVFQPDGTILLHRLSCTPQAKAALQVAVNSAATRGLGHVTSVDLLYGLLKAHTNSQQDWCNDALFSVGASPAVVLEEILLLLESAPLSQTELHELQVPLEDSTQLSWATVHTFAWN